MTDYPEEQRASQSAKPVDSHKEANDHPVGEVGEVVVVAASLNDYKEEAVGEDEVEEALVNKDEEAPREDNEADNEAPREDKEADKEAPREDKEADKEAPADDDDDNEDEVVFNCPLNCPLMGIDVEELTGPSKMGGVVGGDEALLKKIGDIFSNEFAKYGKQPIQRGNGGNGGNAALLKKIEELVSREKSLVNQPVQGECNEDLYKRFDDVSVEIKQQVEILGHQSLNFLEQIKGTIDTIVSALTVTPLQQVADSVDPFEEMARLVDEGKYEDAIIAALRTGVDSTVLWLCLQLNLTGILSTLDMDQNLLLAFFRSLGSRTAIGSTAIGSTELKVSLNHLIKLAVLIQPTAHFFRPVFHQVLQTLEDSPAVRADPNYSTLSCLMQLKLQLSCYD